VLKAVEELGLHPKELRRQVKRNHIFTHIRWDMEGIYIEVAQPEGDFLWLTGEQIKKEAALPTAFRQFWEEIQDV
jgi:A/G-specific adenine glycosylase